MIINYRKVLTGAAIAGGGAALTYLSQWAGQTDFGSLTPIVTAGFAIGINFFRKLAQGYEG
jgi:hypothetical protein